ncbi:hypothetical protein EDD59_10825 [Muricomes intestini]|uniref:Amidohydrolase 3 domain-containing protein n=1 Tax=Muricomes intestini TaxID=1796634 RepID=A0A4R3K978_9FIRM|nr:amidohydrolase family protein [Muricomes intestini]TCS79445.1 hypothetical protein EDD59_10825 [Muricomes intestini]
MKADKILRSNAIFTSLDKEPFPGFVAIKGDKIIAVGNGNEMDYLDSYTEVTDLGGQLICPGFVDVHCFFTGYLLMQTGIDVSSCPTGENVLQAISSHSKMLKSGKPLLARGLKPEIFFSVQTLDHLFPDIPIIIFIEGHENCCMNSLAISTYGFTPDKCYSEAYWKLLRYVLSDIEYSLRKFKDYLSMLNSRGITSIKEMGFDDYYSFTDILKSLESQSALTARIHFMSQPVGAPMNLEYGKEMRKKFQGDFVRFSGYNQMTDGSISQLEADMKEPYLIADTCCKLNINWIKLEQDTLTADQNGFRFSLHAQGDGAIHKVLNIFSKCRKAKDGTILHRHAITDLECSDPEDLEYMGKLGITAEVYPQIMSLASRSEKVAVINETIGSERGKNYWNRRKMEDSNVTLSCGTDLPLLFDDIPESIYHAVFGLFPEGGEPFNPENALSIDELLKAWTIGGQYNLGQDNILGTLEPGKKADIAVLDHNVFEVPIDEMRKVKVSLTMVDGKIVYRI